MGCLCSAFIRLFQYSNAEFPQKSTFNDSINKCKLPVADGRGDVSIGGWPRIADRLRPTGTIICQVIMVDFPDSPSFISPHEAYSKISQASDVFNEMSYGKLHFIMQPHFKWLRMSKLSTEYNDNGNWTFIQHKQYIVEATQLAIDDDTDFSESDCFIILANPNATGFGYCGPAFCSINNTGIILSGKYFGNGATSAADLDKWGSMWANHELTHAMGLVDLYAFYPSSHENHKFPFTGEISYMGLSSFQSNSPSLFAFERWNIGWLEDSQIICCDKIKLSCDSGQTVCITPIEIPGGIKAAIVPTSSTTVICVECRRPIGIDCKLAKSGSLVYLVDSSIQSGMGPIKVYPCDLQNDPRFLLAPRSLGESVTVAGLTVCVIASAQYEDTVRITMRR